MAKKKKAKKPKVKISKKKALILTAAIFGVCALFLALSVAMSVPKKPKFVEPQKVEEAKKEQPKKKEQGKPPVKIEQPKIETPKTKPTQKPESQPTETPKQKTKEPEQPKVQVPPKVVQPKPQEPEQPRIAPPAVIPPAKNGARLVFVFDDGGQNLSHLQRFLDLPFPITVAVLPRLQYSAESGRRVVAAGKQLMLHQPMQALNESVNPGQGAIKPEMSIAEIDKLLAENVASVGNVVGMNNHEGSRISENQVQIGAVLDFCNANKMFYLDSRTTAQTRAPQAAMERGFDIYERDVFLDNEKTRDNIIHEIERGVEIANKKGRCIMIGHIWSADILPKVLMEVYPELVKNGYTIEILK